MARHKRPAYYAAPLRSRKQIIDFLVDHKSYWNDNGDNSPLAWDVKCYGVDLDADHLIEVFRTSGEYDTREGGDRWLDYPEWRKPALAKYKEIENDLFEYAIEDARSNVTDCDTNRCLWKGDLLDVKYAFSGRSGGWLIITSYNGANLTKMDKDDFVEWLQEMPFKDLRNLYELITQNDHDFNIKAVEADVELCAALAWIENACHGIPQPDKTQAELALTV